MANGARRPAKARFDATTVDRDLLYRLFGGRGWFTADQVVAKVVPNVARHVGIRRALAGGEQSPAGSDGRTEEELDALNRAGLKKIVVALLEGMARDELATKRGKRPTVAYELPPKPRRGRRPDAVGFGVDDMRAAVRASPGIDMERLIDAVLAAAPPDRLLHRYSTNLGRELTAAERGDRSTLRAAARTILFRAAALLAREESGKLRTERVETIRFYIDS